jgi:hypothetical protein
MIALLVVPSFAVDTNSAFQFNSDGKFKIMMINDTQDVILKDVLQADYLKKIAAQEQPDLIIMAGDLITDFFPGATREALEKCLRQSLEAINSLGIPFVATFGNHDHDWEDIFPLEEQMEVYKSYSNCAIVNNGCDIGTYNITVKSSDGKSIPLNIYVMDSNNKAVGEGLLTGYQGLKPEQVQWYKDTRDALKEETGDYVPSLVFQHVPVKEIYQFVDTVPFNEDHTDCIFSIDDGQWYKLNDKVISGSLGEVPCSESVNGNTGEYEAWLEQGEVIGAFFAHDHVNTFVGVTDEGIKMGYNGGSGFSTYGNGGDRSARIFEIDENDVENYDTYLVTYNDVEPISINYYIMDLFSPVIATVIGRIIDIICPQFIKDIVVKFK